MSSQQHSQFDSSQQHIFNQKLKPTGKGIREGFIDIVSVYYKSNFVCFVTIHGLTEASGNYIVLEL
jgi:hypothetical protein